MATTHAANETSRSLRRETMPDLSNRSYPDTDSPTVGQRLRALREQRKLSQRELARRSGVTNGMISLIEQDKTSPSVALLK